MLNILGNHAVIWLHKRHVICKIMF